MNNKKLITIISFAVLIFILAIFLKKNRWYREADVAKHSNANSCWMIINGNVYDVTSLINSHTGGEKAILDICGKDGSDIFNSRHGNESDPKTELENYKIGIFH